jgi:hypothetical protein
MTDYRSDPVSPKSRSSLKFRRTASKRFWLTSRVTSLRILFDNNVPAGVRRFW